jgi:hypothetical protein
MKDEERNRAAFILHPSAFVFLRSLDAAGPIR